MKKQLTLAKYYRLLLAFIEKRGYVIDPKCFPPSLRNLQSEADTVDINDVNQFLISVLESTKDHSLSFEFGDTLDIETHGFFGYAVRSTDSMEEALNVEQKYVNTLFSEIRVSLDVFDSYFLSTFHFSAPEQLIPFYAELCLAVGRRIVLSTLGDIFDKGVITVNLTYPEPQYIHLYKKHLGYGFRFNQGSNSIEIPIEMLGAQNPQKDETLKALSIGELDKLSHKNSTDVLHKVKSIIRENLNGEQDIENTASQLHMTSRTLRRKLALYHTSYSELVKDTKIRTAIDLLKSTSLTLEEISEEIGYGHSSTFSTAFKQRMGMTPNQFRKKANY